MNTEPICATIKSSEVVHASGRSCLLPERWLGGDCQFAKAGKCSIYDAGDCRASSAMTRKEVKEMLEATGVTNRFSLRTVSFCDLARDQAQVVTIKDWQPDPKADKIKAAFRQRGLIVEFDY